MKNTITKFIKKLLSERDSDKWFRDLPKGFQEALLNPVDSEQELQRQFNASQIIAIDSKRIAMISRFIYVNEFPNWYIAGRVLVLSSQKVKPVKLWLNIEKIKLMEILSTAIQSLGDVSKEDVFKSEHTLWQTRQFTELEEKYYDEIRSSRSYTKKSQS